DKQARKKVKLPAVVSSKQWQVYEEKRKEKKKEEEKQKEERKRKREEKRKEKSKGTKKTKKKLVYDKEDDWTCKVCNKRYSAELILKIRRRWIECDKCTNTYHYKCIPKKHLDAFGIEESDDDDDELAFYCHNCANDIDTDTEPLGLDLSDTEDEDM
ncbi:hypothetical protein J6590_107964, partial [Homalodisca vitripennis]